MVVPYLYLFSWVTCKVKRKLTFLSILIEMKLNPRGIEVRRKPAQKRAQMTVQAMLDAATKPARADLLLLGDLRYSSGRLTLPHPEASSRRFVLVPLLELDPELTLPGGESLAEQLEQLPAGGAVRRVGPPLFERG